MVQYLEERNERFQSEKPAHTQLRFIQLRNLGRASEMSWQQRCAELVDWLRLARNLYISRGALELLHRSAFFLRVSVFHYYSTASRSSSLRNSQQQWPRPTEESAATATATQEPAPRRMAASVVTATAPQEPAQTRTEESAATATAPLEPAPRNK